MAGGGGGGGNARQAGATTLTQSSENFGYSAVRLRRIVKLQFGIINPHELVSVNFSWRFFCFFGTMGVVEIVCT